MTRRDGDEFARHGSLDGGLTPVVPIAPTSVADLHRRATDPAPPVDDVEPDTWKVPVYLGVGLAQRIADGAPLTPADQEMLQVEAQIAVRWYEPAPDRRRRQRRRRWPRFIHAIGGTRP